MKGHDLIPLDFKLIKDLIGNVNNEDRFIHSSFGFVRSSKGVKDVVNQLLITRQPYRLMEGRIMFLWKGEADINLNLRKRHLKAPMAVLLSPGTVGEIVDFSSDYDFTMLAFRNDFMESFRREEILQIYRQRWLCLCIPLQDEEQQRIEKICDLFWDIIHDSPLPEKIVKEMILLLLNQVDTYRKRYLAEEHPPVSHREEIFNRFIDLVNEYAIRERKIAFYADKLCLTPHYLSSLIRETGRQTVMDWINLAVIQEAKLLLHHSDLQITQIADRLNFPNASFFCKYFRRLTGMSPNEYRRKNM